MIKKRKEKKKRGQKKNDFGIHGIERLLNEPVSEHESIIFHNDCLLEIGVFFDGIHFQKKKKMELVPLHDLILRPVKRLMKNYLKKINRFMSLVRMQLMNINEILCEIRNDLIW